MMMKKKTRCIEDDLVLEVEEMVFGLEVEGVGVGVKSSLK